MAEFRRHFRIKESTPVRWRIKDKNVEGRGEVLNISQSGLLLETDSAFSPLDDSELILEPIEENIQFLPQNGRLVWFKKIKVVNTRFWCGLEFVAPTAKVIDEIKKRVENAQEELGQVGNLNILQNYYV